MDALVAAGWGALGASALLLGAWVALTFKPRDSTVGDIMAFGAGTLLAAVAYELVPKHEVPGLWGAVWFGLGALVFYLADRLLTRPGAGEDRSITLGALLDGVPESLVLGMSLAVGGEVGLAFLCAVFISNLPESLGASAGMREEGRPPGAIYKIWAGIVLASAVAAVVGYLTVQAIPQLDADYVEAFAAGAVITMLAGSMMPEAYREGGKAAGLYTALGFAAAGILSALE